MRENAPSAIFPSRTVFLFVQSLHDQIDTFIWRFLSRAVFFVGEIVHGFDDFDHVFAVDESIFVLICRRNGCVERLKVALARHLP